MEKRLDGKAAIVTGAARGIGEGIARVLASQGAGVLIVDRDEEGASRVARELRAEGARADHALTDVSSAAEVGAMARKALDLFGRIDILCPNAAIFDSSSIAEMPEALWDRLMSVNLKGVFLCVQACLPAMTAQRYGRIVVTSSITGVRTAIPGMAHYA
ncbi:MAG: 3-oxoacyl-[acyl-carrier protein] reductase, partial [Rhodospirillaceae bacterium]|nr:3-oxoacyl-[acyl-carrier protein] reductase [Rhodospirillaceae bacterium]